MGSAAVLGWHVSPISIPACDRTIAQARWGGVYRQSIVSESARLRRNSFVHKVYTFYSRQLIAAAQQITPLSKLSHIFHHTLIVTSDYYHNTCCCCSQAGFEFRWPGWQKKRSRRAEISPCRAGPKNFALCRTLVHTPISHLRSHAFVLQVPVTETSGCRYSLI